MKVKQKVRFPEVSQGGKRPLFLHSSPACAQAQHFSSQLSTTSRTCHLPDSSFIIKSIDLICYLCPVLSVTERIKSNEL